jgi:hypothetical protein
MNPEEIRASHKLFRLHLAHLRLGHAREVEIDAH